MRAKESADTYNQYIQEKYKEAAKTNTKAQKRLEQLMQNIELTPNYQVGGQKKPIYVESENDSRYKAYNDSLSLYKTSLKNMWAEKNRSKSKVTKKGFIPFDEFNTFVPGSNFKVVWFIACNFNFIAC